MGASQSFPYDTTVYLTLEDEPVVDVLPSQLMCLFKKTGQTAFQVRALDSTTFFNLGTGFYCIRWDETHTDIMGKVFYTLVSNRFDNFISDEFDVDTPVAEASSLPGTCLISGNVATLGGNAGNGVPILIRGIDYPIIAETSLLTSEPLRIYTGPTGDFQVRLVRGTTVIFEVERTGFRLQVQVPDRGTARLVDLVPPP